MRAILFVLLIALAYSVDAYSVSGNKILDGNGNQVLLRGVDRPSLEWSATGEALSLADYTIMRDQWHANIVRLSLNQCFWLGSGGSAYQSLIAQQVSWIKSLGLGVILDLHWNDAGTGTCAQQNIFDANSVTFWQQLAAIYKNDPLIAFELYNEPHDVSWSVWRNGGSAGSYNTPGFQALYTAVRGTGANNVVIIGGLNYAYDLSGVASYAITGTNIAYSTHPYNYGGKQLGDWPSGFGYLAATYPIIATEFGDYDCGTQYYIDFTNYANTNGIHWTSWAWYPNGCSFPSIITDYTGAPTPSGAIVKAALIASNPNPGQGSSSAATTAKSSSTSSTSAKASTSTSTSTSTTAKPSSTSTTAKSSTTTGSAGSTSGSSSGGISVTLKNGAGPYWLAVSFANAAQTVTAVSFQGTGGSWVAGTVAQWDTPVWIYSGGALTAPVSLQITAGSETLTLNGIISTINANGQTFTSSAQF